MTSKETLAVFVLALVSNTLGSVLLKKGASRGLAANGSSKSKRAPVFALEMLQSKEIAIGLLLEMSAIVGWLVFVSRSALSVAFPLSSISNVTILLASHYLLQERISPRRWGGVTLIVGGIILIANA